MVEAGDGHSPQQEIHEYEPSDFLKELREPEKRTPMYGIGIGSSDTKKYHNVFFLEPYEEGYHVHMSVVDPVSPSNIQYFGTVEGPVKAITITTNLDREVETTGFSVGFTNCVSMGLFSEEQVGAAVTDPSHELHILFSDFYKIAKALQEERMANGALDPYMSMSRDVLSKRKSDNKEFEIGRIIRDEFLHLAKNSIAKKFMELGVNALFENSEKRDGTIDREEIQERMLAFMRNPSIEEATYLRYVLGSMAPWSRTEIESTGNYFYGKTAHLKYTQPHTHLASYVNLSILHNLCLEEESPFSREELEAAAHVVNQGKAKMRKAVTARSRTDKKASTSTEQKDDWVLTPQRSRRGGTPKKPKPAKFNPFDPGRVEHLFRQLEREKEIKMKKP